MNRTSISFDIHRTNWNNKYLFPDIVYIDTCAIMDIFQQRTHGQVTEDYIKELVNRDGMIIWSQHTIDEITQFYHVDHYHKLAKSKNITGNKAWKKAEDTATDQESVNIAQSVLNQVNKVIKYLEQFGVQTDVDVTDSKLVNDLTRTVYSRYGGNQYDSKHFVIAHLSGVNNILTQDSGYLRYPNVNIFGASNELVKNSKSGQAWNSYIDLSKLLHDKEDDDENNKENAS